MELILVFLAGVFLGISITTVMFRVFLVGALRIDNSEPEEGPYLFLELSKGIGDISSKKYVLLKVNLKNFIPHK